jgi:hypothetical protein
MTNDNRREAVEQVMSDLLFVGMTQENVRHALDRAADIPDWRQER